MSDERETINRTLAEFVGKCWHDYGHNHALGREDRCLKCGYQPNSFEHNFGVDKPDFTSSDSPRRLLEEVVDKLCSNPNTKTRELVSELDHLVPQPKGYNFALKTIATLTAEQIATACYRVITDSNVAT